MCVALTVELVDGNFDAIAAHQHEVDVLCELFGCVLATIPRHPVRICVDVVEVLHGHEGTLACVDEALGVHQLAEIVSEIVLVFDRGDDGQLFLFKLDAELRCDLLEQACGKFIELFVSEPCYSLLSFGVFRCVQGTRHQCAGPM